MVFFYSTPRTLINGTPCSPKKKKSPDPNLKAIKERVSSLRDSNDIFGENSHAPEHHDFRKDFITILPEEFGRSIEIGPVSTTYLEEIAPSLTNGRQHFVVPESREKAHKILELIKKSETLYPKLRDKSIVLIGVSEGDKKKKKWENSSSDSENSSSKKDSKKNGKKDGKTPPKEKFRLASTDPEAEVIINSNNPFKAFNNIPDRYFHAIYIHSKYCKESKVGQESEKRFDLLNHSFKIEENTCMKKLVRRALPKVAEGGLLGGEGFCFPPDEFGKKENEYLNYPGGNKYFDFVPLCGTDKNGASPRYKITVNVENENDRGSR